MTTRAPFLAVLLLVVAVSGVAADGSGTVDFEAAAHGPAMIGGPLRALRSSLQPADAGLPSGDDPALEGESVSLAAGSLVVTRHFFRSNESVLGAGVQGNEEQQRHDLGAASLAATQVRQGHDVFMAGLEGASAPNLQWNVGSGRLSVTQDARTNQPGNGATTTPRQVPVAGTVAWVGDTAGSTLVVTGDFFLALYDIDINVESGEGTTQFRSGRAYENVGGTTPGQPTVGSSESAILEIVAHDAVLTWTTATEHVEFVYLESADISPGGALHLTNADGTIASGENAATVSGEDVVAPAGSSLSGVRTDGAKLTGTLDLGEANSLLIGGRRVEFQPDSSTAATPQGSKAANLLWLVATIVIVGGAALLVYRRPPFSLVTWAMDLRRYGYVARRATRFLPQPERSARASVMRAVSLFALERQQEAKDFLETLPEQWQPERPTMDYLMAMVRAWEGRDEEAVTLLTDCLQQAPEYRHEILANPMFVRLLEVPSNQVLFVKEGYT